MPPDPTLESLREAARSCEGCDLYADATQTVFGEGGRGSMVMLVGEQPGDREDVEGAPFVGPAGHLLDRALRDAGIDRSKTYVTNAVKHFKWEPRGKRRLHKTPSAGEVEACRPWLDAEIAVVGPDVVVCMGATAARALLGPSFRVTHDRGVPLTAAGRTVVVTVHPSSILRAPDEAREAAYGAFVDDLRAVAAILRG
ncbi:MAG TPA: UdgX family uracil-DNA binding protein [Dehalococcoidia bacterium]|nr:UdgX family uracil-DNA binding protein [Dehalococcoidia bacterium]